MSETDQTQQQSSSNSNSNVSIQQCINHKFVKSVVTRINFLAKQILKYLTTKELLIESILCVAIALGLKYMDIYVWDIHQRPYPYQITEAGDVILDFEVDQPYRDMTVSTTKNYKMNLVGVVLVFSCFAVLSNAPHGDFHCGGCVLAIAFGLSSLFCDTTKRFTGRLRPHFFQSCHFDVDLLECTVDDSEKRLSFPSGHSHMAFTCMSVLAFYLYGKAYGRMRRKGHADWTVRILTLLGFLPLLRAFYVSASIYKDNWHHSADVVAGAIIGFACAFVSYHLW